MPDLTIDPVRTATDLETFAYFPWTVYRGDPWWVPPLISERRKLVDRERFPFFEHSQAEFFIARRGDRVVGTIAGIANRRYNEFHTSNVGWFGFFEVLEDPEAAAGLLATAGDWARAQGFEALLGPAQYSTNEEVGLLIDGFNDTPRIMMTYNPRRYIDYVEQAGFTKAMDLFAYRKSIEHFRTHIPPKLERVVDKVIERGRFRLRKVEMKHFDREIEHVKRLYNSSWERNWGFVPMTEHEFDHLAEQLKPILDPDLVLVVEHEGEPVAFGLTLPDMNEPLVRAYPRPGTPELLTMGKLVWHWKVRHTSKWLRVLALGVQPEFRGQGVDAMLYLQTARNAFSKGYQFAEMSWILESNDMMNRSIRLLGGEVYKTYRVYEKRL